MTADLMLFFPFLTYFLNHGKYVIQDTYKILINLFIYFNLMYKNIKIMYVLSYVFVELKNTQLFIL